MGRVRFSMVLVLSLASLLAGCGGDDEVTMTEVSHQDTKDMVVWSPGGDGPWPVVYALPGSGVAQVDLDVLGPALAEQGVVVFGSDWTGGPAEYHTGVPPGAVHDIECGYRYARQIAEEHGGDLTQPVTVLAYDEGGLAATVPVLDTGLFGPDGAYGACFSGVSRPELLVTLASCHNNYLEQRSVSFEGSDTTVVLMSGENDDVCPASMHNSAMLDTLDELGIEAVTTEIAAADHGQLVFHDQDHAWAALPSDETVGQATVTAILEAIENAQ